MEFVVAGVATVISALATALVAWQQKKRARERDVFLKELSLSREDLDRKLRNRLVHLIPYKFGPIPVVAVEKKQEISPEVKQVEQDLGNAIFKAISALPTLSKEQIEQEIDKRVESLSQRLGQIEKRFPDEGNLEKIASLNDAILATRLEVLDEHLVKMESKLISKWEVAKIVFAVLTMLGALLGLTFALIQYLSTTLGK